MSIKIRPDIGQIVICDFTGFVPPEMTKRRPVINLTPKARFGSLCTVVPLSTTAPNPVQSWHMRLRISLPRPYDNPECWVKGDMLYTVAFSRLDLFKLGKVDGKRQYACPTVPAEEMSKVWRCVLYGLGRGDIIRSLNPPEGKTIMIEERVVRKTTVFQREDPKDLD